MKELSPEKQALAIQGSKMFERAQRIVSNPSAYPNEDPMQAQMILDGGPGPNLCKADPELAEVISLGLYHYSGIEISLIPENSDESSWPIDLN